MKKAKQKIKAYRPTLFVRDSLSSHTTLVAALIKVLGVTDGYPSLPVTRGNELRRPMALPASEMGMVTRRWLFPQWNRPKGRHLITCQARNGSGLFLWADKRC